MQNTTSASSNNTKKRGRPPKNETNKRNEQVTNEFCSLSNSIALSNYYFGLNLFDMYTPDQLSDLAKNPIENNDILRKVSLMLYGSNGTYTNTVDYMVAMPTLDKVIVPHGKNASKRKKNKELMESTLYLIKDKEIIRDALFKGMVEGIAFYYFETTSRPQSNTKTMTDYDIENIVEINELGINASVISLPVDYTRIVGRKNNSYVIAFNLDYFDDEIGEAREKKLRKYPKEIRDAYTNRVNHPDNGNWVVLDNTRTIVHKIRSKADEKWGRP